MSDWNDISKEEYQTKLRAQKERELRWLQHGGGWHCPKCGSRGTVSLSGAALCGGCGELVSSIKRECEPCA